MRNVYKAIAEAVPDFFFIYDLELEKVTFICPKLQKLINQHNDPHKKHSLQEDFIDPSDQRKLIEFLKNLGPANHYTAKTELKVKKIDEMQFIELNTFPLNGKEKKITKVVGHITNVTERKEATKMLAERTEKLEEKKEELEKTLHILAHDLRSPFSQVKALSELMMHEMNEEEKKKFSSYLLILNSIGTRSMDLVDALMKYVWIKEQVGNLSLTPYNLKNILEEAVDQFKDKIKERELKIEYRIEEKQMVVNVDVAIFRQVFINLLSNAIKFTPKGGKIIFSTSNRGELTYIYVQDTGIGMSEKQMEQLFKPFSRERKDGLCGEKSFGLGLTICRQIVKAHAGKLWVESKEGEGTTFAIAIPQLKNGNRKANAGRRIQSKKDHVKN